MQVPEIARKGHTMVGRSAPVSGNVRKRATHGWTFGVGVGKRPERFLECVDCVGRPEILQLGVCSRHVVVDLQWRLVALAMANLLNLDFGDFPDNEGKVRYDHTNLEPPSSTAGVPANKRPKKERKKAHVLDLFLFGFTGSFV